MISGKQQELRRDSDLQSDENSFLESAMITSYGDKDQIKALNHNHDMIPT